MSINIIGISAYFHDSACCLLRDGRLVAAAQEERFSRQKHDAGFPKRALRYCLEEGGLTIADVDGVAFYEDPGRKLGRQLWAGGMALFRNPSVARLDVGRAEREIREIGAYEGEIHFVEHHQAHSASSFYFSGFQEAATFTVDGVGEWATTTYGWGRETYMEIFEEVHFPDSIGLLYSTLTGYLGFSVNDGEYKVMGLAPYGRPVYADKVRELIQSGNRGQYRLNLKYFDFQRPDRMHSDLLVELFGQPARKPESELTTFHQDLARSLQVVLEEVLLEKVNYLHEVVPSENLCMAGGVALNCVANRRILNNGPFKKLFVQPAANDAGGALGAAAIAHVNITGRGLLETPLKHVYQGPSFSPAEIAETLTPAMKALDFRDREEELLAATVSRLLEGKVVGWFHGRMEFGPRALGARSILADPRDPRMRDRINALVKKREAFRPFAPVILEDALKDHFDLDHPSPFMLETCKVTSQLDLPAITHVDRSARVQTVDFKTSPRFARLIEMFGRASGCPILLNTSFNMRDEPIVCSPVDALICFVRSEIDTLILEDFLIDRASLCESWSDLVRQVSRPRTQAINYRVYTF
jgi:carbamoyltransferase